MPAFFMHNISFIATLIWIEKLFPNVRVFIDPDVTTVHFWTFFHSTCTYCKPTYSLLLPAWCKIDSPIIEILPQKTELSFSFASSENDSSVTMNERLAPLQLVICLVSKTGLVCKEQISQTKHTTSNSHILWYDIIFYLSLRQGLSPSLCAKR